MQRMMMKSWKIVYSLMIQQIIISDGDYSDFKNLEEEFEENDEEYLNKLLLGEVRIIMALQDLLDLSTKRKKKDWFI